MELKNTIVAILAIFCVVFSACAVCAADDVSGNFTADEAQTVYDEMILPPDYAHDESATGQAAGGDVDGNETHNSMVLPPDYAHDEAAMMNATNATGHAAGENTANATNNATASAHTMPATGNPILALLAVGAVLGGACVLKRK